MLLQVLCDCFQAEFVASREMSDKQHMCLARHSEVSPMQRPRIHRSRRIIDQIHPNGGVAAFRHLPEIWRRDSEQRSENGSNGYGCDISLFRPEGPH
jgi:hypothetical protein